MRFLLILLIAFLTLSTVFDWDPGPAPGVKLKNAILYAMTLVLMLRTSMDRNFRVQLPGIQIAFVVLISYAVLTYVAIVFVIQYLQYNALENALTLKEIVDQMLFFLVFFYGTRSQRDAMVILKCLLVTFALSHFMAVLDAVGVVSFGDLEQREDGRVEGAIGESNQYGAFVAMSLPAIAAMVFTTRGLQRLLWVAASAMTAITLLMTVSRGAFVAVVFAGAAALVLFRRYAPPGRLAVIAIAGVVATVAIGVVTMVLGFGDLLYERVLNTTGDLGTTSSGRTETWLNALEVMFEQPISLLTGFGWRSYWSMPFRYSPHNHYLNQWFNLGVVGLACSILLFVLPIRSARAALDRAVGAARPILMGFVVGTVALAAAVFFVDLYKPWLYFWAYAGLAMRLAVNAPEHAREAVQSGRAVAAPGPVSDPFGWKAALDRLGPVRGAMQRHLPSRAARQ